MVNARDGGINGVKITFEECETGYATDRGVECYERLKGKGPTGATLFQPAVDRHHLRADRARRRPTRSRWSPMGYGRADSRDGAVFPWNFPLLGTYWAAADVADPVRRQEGGRLDKLKGKKIALVYHDSPYGKEPIPLLEELRQDARLRAPADPGDGARASSRRRPGCRSASSAPTTCSCGAGA